MSFFLVKSSTSCLCLSVISSEPLTFKKFEMRFSVPVSKWFVVLFWEFTWADLVVALLIIREIGSAFVPCFLVLWEIWSEKRSHLRPRCGFLGFEYDWDFLQPCCGYFDEKFLIGKILQCTLVYHHNSKIARTLGLGSYKNCPKRIRIFQVFQSSESRWRQPNHDCAKTFQSVK